MVNPADGTLHSATSTVLPSQQERTTVDAPNSASHAPRRPAGERAGVIEPSTISIGGTQAVSIAPDVRRYQGRWRYAKRALDLTIAAATLPLTLPLMAVVA